MGKVKAGADVVPETQAPAVTVAGIYPAMVKVMQSIDFIGKFTKNSAQGFMFRGIDDVMNSLHKVMAENNIFVVPNVVGQPIRTERKTDRGGLLFSCVQEFRFDLTHADGSFVSIGMFGEAMDSGDKAMSKCASIALKYALLQAFMIPTEDPIIDGERASKDPDATAHNVVAPKEPPKVATLASMREAIGESDEVLTAFLLEKKVLKAGQTLADVPQEDLTRLESNSVSCKALIAAWKKQQAKA